MWRELQVNIAKTCIVSNYATVGLRSGNRSVWVASACLENESSNKAEEGLIRFQEFMNDAADMQKDITEEHRRGDWSDDVNLKHYDRNNSQGHVVHPILKAQGWTTAAPRPTN